MAELHQLAWKTSVQRLSIFNLNGPRLARPNGRDNSATRLSHQQTINIRTYDIVAVPMNKQQMWKTGQVENRREFFSVVQQTKTGSIQCQIYYPP